MLFSSPAFLLILLPISVAGFAIARAQSLLAAKVWLIACSLAFYAWTTAQNLPILAASVAFNWFVARRIHQTGSKRLLALGIVANCAALTLFKYTPFIVDTVNDGIDIRWSVPNILLPLGISFYTFQQIAFLIDVHAGRTLPHGPIDHALFVSFFPHVVSGPITRSDETVPQFHDEARFRLRADSLASGMTLFVVGLFKKLAVADPFGRTVDPIFAQAHAGSVQLIEAWVGALSYALQMYFDFSGYSDMALGLGLIFGIALPINFNSPYKARSVIEYWSRWHMTLTRFLTGYIYNPIVLRLMRRRVEQGRPLPRRGKMSVGTFAALVAWPTMLTMLISGIWHGAGWQFVIFGLLHGLFLVVAHGWRAFKVHQGWPEAGGRMAVMGSVLLTFLCATVALVFFRAPSVGAAVHLIGGMAGFNGLTLPPQIASLDIIGQAATALGAHFAPLDGIGALTVARLIVFLAVVWLLPNAYEWLRAVQTAVDTTAAQWRQNALPLPAWRPTPVLGLLLGAGSLVLVLFSLSAAPAEFIYSRF